jgi:hypothetical protein
VTLLFFSVVINGSTNTVIRFVCHVYLAVPNKNLVILGFSVRNPRQ